jgi:hypothetical protein
VSTLLHATVYVSTQFAECTSTDCNIAQGQLYFYLLPYGSCKARSEFQLVYDCKMKFVINDIAMVSQGLAKRH